MEELLERVELLQTHQVTEIKCHRLNVTVEKGENIRKGTIRDIIDIPDPYVELLVKGIPQGNPRTNTIDNTKNPIWNEMFTFYLDPSKEYNLEVAVYDENVGKDEQIGRQTIGLKHLKPEENVTKVLEIGKRGKIYLKLLLEEDWEPDLRYSTDLCENEKEFISKRKENVFKAVKGVLEPADSPNSVDEIPIIGVLASGGGYRALIGYAGAMAALHKSGILDCVSYIAALSGSSWYLAWLFSHPEYFSKGPAGLLEELRERLSVRSYKSAMRKITSQVKKVKEKQNDKLPVSFTDLFGHLVGEMLLLNRKNGKFSDVQEKLKDSNAPLPLCTCLSVKNDVSARNFGEWIEFSPYEVGWTKYGIFMEMQHFGSLFYMGNIVQQYPELPLHFLLGCWGNAFSISIDRILPGGDSDVFKKRVPGTQDTTDSPRKGLPIVGKDSLVLKGETGTLTRFRRRKRVNLQQGGATNHHQSSSSATNHHGLHRSINNQTNGIATGVSGKDRMKLDAEKNGNGEDNREEEMDVTENYSTEENEDDEEEEDSDEEEKEKDRYGFWMNVLIRAMKNSEIFQNRELRAGRVFNPLRGIPFKATVPGSSSKEGVQKEAEHLILADAGLSINLPFPVLHRPQRGVDIYLTFDFSTRQTDLHEPFKEIILAEIWAKKNKVPFPPIKELAKKYCKEPMREIYIFNNRDEAGCPIIIHFVLFNDAFRLFKMPGVERRTQEEKDFADFDIFTDPAFSMFNFKYKVANFDKLSKLTEFNTLLGLDIIKEQMKIVIRKKQTSSKWKKIKNLFKNPFRSNKS